METLRRATIYGTRDQAAAKELLNITRTRALETGSGKPDALALFDYGYLGETMKQAWATKDLCDNIGPANGVDGYAYIRQALQLRGPDAEMEFAAALDFVAPAARPAGALPPCIERSRQRSALGGKPVENLLGPGQIPCRIA
jgi:hypothetical protein